MSPPTSLAPGLAFVVVALTWAAVPVAPGAELPLPEDVFAAATDDAIQDVLLLTDSCPLFVRFHVRVGSDGFRTVWSHFVDRLYGFLDGDGNGVLTLKEAQQSNWQQLFENALNGRGTAATPVASSSASALDSRPRDGTVSRDELARFLRTSLGFAEFGIQPGAPPDPKSLALFGLLDGDRDGMLSPAELAPAATDALLARLDLDEDELISLPEFRPFENAYGTRYRAVAVPAGASAGMAADSRNSVIVPLGPGAAATVSALVERLLSKYDRGTTADPKDGRLSCAELGSAARSETVRRFDADGDGGLGPAELKALLVQPVPDIVLNIVLAPAGGGGGDAPATIAIAGITSSAAISATASAPGSGTGPVRLVREGVALEFAVEDNLLVTRVALDRQFDLADADKNGYVDKSEAVQYRFLQQSFDVADRDHDGKLYKAELERYLERQSDAQSSRVMLTFSDRGRSLFELLDTDGDRRLGLRELRQAGARLAGCDPDGQIHGAGDGSGDRDGGVARSAVPRQYRLGIGRGPAPLRPLGIDPYAYTGGPDPPGGRGGPAWFAKMDRNRDGDISRREFLGTRDQFRRLDGDGDGLIDPREAGGKE